MKPVQVKLACLLALLCAAAVHADDPWKSKSPNQWTKKEVDRILRESPWTRIISTPTTWARPGGEKFSIGPSSTVTIDSNGARLGTRRSDDPDDPQNYEGYFLLRWSSSQTVQQALERQAALRRASAPPQASAKAPAKSDKRPAAPDDAYELELVWDLFARFVTATEDEVAMNSYLKPSRLGVEFRPSRVEYRRGAAGVVTSVVFYFSKQGATGALIGAQEDRVDFYWGVGPSSLQARFNPRKMVAGGKTDY